jgi:hypothetical protein
VADLVHLSPTSGPAPTLDGHFATKSYVDAGRTDMAINARTANYTLVLADRGKCVEVSSTSTTTVTVPTNATVAFPVGTVIRVRKTNTGNVSVQGAGGVTIDWASVFTISTRYAMAEIHKVGADQWRGVLLGT